MPSYTNSSGSTAYFTWTSNSTFWNDVINQGTYKIPEPEPCATCGMQVPKRDEVEHADLHAQGL